jgi:histone H3/H4
MKISNALVRKMAKSHSDIRMSSEAAAAIAKILEKKAAMIAKHAVKKAKKEGRSIVTEEDIDTYRLKFGD